MTYSIFDNGNLVVSFDREDEAHGALERIAAVHPEGTDDLLLVTFDDDGKLVDDCAPGARLAQTC